MAMLTRLKHYVSHIFIIFSACLMPVYASNVNNDIISILPFEAPLSDDEVNKFVKLVVDVRQVGRIGQQLFTYRPENVIAGNGWNVDSVDDLICINKEYTTQGYSKIANDDIIKFMKTQSSDDIRRYIVILEDGLPEAMFLNSQLSIQAELLIKLGYLDRADEAYFIKETDVLSEKHLEVHNAFYDNPDYEDLNHFILTGKLPNETDNSGLSGFQQGMDFGMLQSSLLSNYVKNQCDL